MKNSKRKLTKWVSRFEQGYKSYLAFFAQLLLWFLALLFLMPIFAGLLNTVFGASFSINDFMLIVTAAFVVASTYEAKKMRLQARETDLRVVVLRQGFIGDWNELKIVMENQKLISGKPVEFKVVKGVAVDLRGWVVIDKKKYKLHFGNNISNLGDGMAAFCEKWGWLEEGAVVLAIHVSDNYDSDLGENRIILNYANIEGKKYCTIEHEDFSQESFCCWKDYFPALLHANSKIIFII